MTTFRFKSHTIVLTAALMVGLFGNRHLSAQTHTGNVTINGKLVVGSAVTGATIPQTELHIRDVGNPTLRLEQVGPGLPAQTWDVGGNSFSFFIQNQTLGGAIPFAINTSAPDKSIFVDANGDIGIGTTIPSGGDTVAERELDVVAPSSGGDTRVIVDSTGAGSFSEFLIQEDNVNLWSMGHFQSRFYLFDYISNKEVMTIVEGVDDVKFGAKTNGDTRVLVDSGAAANDFAEVVFQENGSDKWSFGHAAADDRFYIFDYGSGANEAMTIKPGTGNVGLGNNNPTFDLHIGKGPGSSGINAGSTTFTIGSSRSVKENIKPVRADNILDKISGVEVYTYDYIEGPKDKLGLMAEDFHAVFERGSDKTINGQEVQMALWMAVQELEKKATEQAKLVVAQGKRIQELELRIAEQQAVAQQLRIKELESLLARKNGN